MTWQTVSTVIVAIWYFARKWYIKLSKILSPILEEAERRARDGKIDKEDRKECALMLISNLEKEGKLKLNFFEKLVLNKAIDSLAGRLPDFIITKEMNEFIKKDNQSDSKKESPA